MKKPNYGITLDSANSILANVKAGQVMIDPTVVPKAKEVVRYWAWRKTNK